MFSHGYYNISRTYRPRLIITTIKTRGGSCCRTASPCRDRSTARGVLTRGGFFYVMRTYYLLHTPTARHIPAFGVEKKRKRQKIDPTATHVVRGVIYVSSRLAKSYIYAFLYAYARSRAVA